MFSNKLLWDKLLVASAEMSANELKIINTVLEERFFFFKFICIGACEIVSVCPENLLEQNYHNLLGEKPFLLIMY